MRVETNNQQMALGGKHPLDFAQHLVRPGGKLQAMVRDDGIDTVTLQRQVVSISNQSHAAPGAICRVDAVIDGAAIEQGVAPGAAKLQNVVAKGCIQQATQRLTSPVQQVLPTVAGIPGFQFGRNIYKLTTYCTSTAR